MNRSKNAILRTGNGIQIRLTKKRKAIIMAMAFLDRTFNTDDLRARVSKNGTQIGKRTVERTLSLLVSVGLLVRYRRKSRRWIYEKVYDTNNGNRLICIVCGKIHEFGNEKIKFETQSVCQKYNFKVESVTSNIFGVCLYCRYFDSKYN